MRLLILGGNSDIGLAIAHEYAKNDGAHITLASRNLVEIEKKANDICLRYQVKASAIYFDAIDFKNHTIFYEHLDPKPDGVVVAFGYTNDQIKAQQHFDEAYHSVCINYLGAVSILEIIAEDFAQKGRGFIIGISSVAGDRGRQSNYIYGSAKAGFTAYLSGLRNRMFQSGVQVMTVKPGFVRTKMTADMDLPQKLVMQPQEVAKNIYRCQKKKGDMTYTKWLWSVMMLFIRTIPEKIFKRLKL
jgi:short-subunit dehydrogenase